VTDDTFLSRWSRRKVQARQGVPLKPPPVPASDPVMAVVPAAETAVTSLPAQSVDTAPAPGSSEQQRPPAPTLADVAELTPESDFSRFVAPDVDGEVKNAALKKLFSDPHFHVMDGLDVYIDDYTKPDPLPAASLRKMAQAAFLGLVEAEPPAAGAAPMATTVATAQTPKSAQVEAAEPGEAEDAASGGVTPEPDENADLRLQPHDAAGCGSAEDSAAGHERRQS
jgi:hypothetical protein